VRRIAAEIQQCVSAAGRAGKKFANATGAGGSSHFPYRLFCPRIFSNGYSVARAAVNGLSVKGPVEGDFGAGSNPAYPNPGDSGGIGRHADLYTPFRSFARPLFHAPPSPNRTSRNDETIQYWVVFV